jgi:hypothetical protein
LERGKKKRIWLRKIEGEVQEAWRGRNGEKRGGYLLNVIRGRNLPLDKLR